MTLGSTGHHVVIEWNVPSKEACKITRRSDLQYHIHDPNTPEATASFLVSLFVEVNRRKVEGLIQSALDKHPSPTEPNPDAENRFDL